MHQSHGSVKDKPLSLETSPAHQKVLQKEENVFELSEENSLNLDDNLLENDFLNLEKLFEKSPQFCLQIPEIQIQKNQGIKNLPSFSWKSPLATPDKYVSFKPKFGNKPKTGCLCAKNMCLRLHCKCFSSGDTCSDTCGCLNCFNSFREEFKLIREEAIKLTQQIDKNAFALKRTKVSANLEVSNVGCKCKTGCSSKHCFCYKFGLGCSPICKCESCLNHRVELDQEVVRKVRLRGSRVKQKIVFRKEVEDVSGECNLPDSDHFSMETSEFGAIVATLQNHGVKKATQ